MNQHCKSGSKEQKKKKRKRAPSLNSTLWISMHPPILKDLLTNAIDFARTIRSFYKKVIDTIMHSRKSLLFSIIEIQAKKDSPNYGDTMGKLR